MHLLYAFIFPHFSFKNTLAPFGFIFSHFSVKSYQLV